MRELIRLEPFTLHLIFPAEQGCLDHHILKQPQLQPQLSSQPRILPKHKKKVRLQLQMELVNYHGSFGQKHLAVLHPLELLLSPESENNTPTRELADRTLWKG